MGEWIKTLDQLPPPFQTVIAYDSETYRSRAAFHNGRGRWFRAEEGGSEIYRVDLWQPLPPPPDAAEKESPR